MFLQCLVIIFYLSCIKANLSTQTTAKPELKDSTIKTEPIIPESTKSTTKTNNENEWQITNGNLIACFSPQCVHIKKFSIASNISLTCTERHLAIDFLSPSNGIYYGYLPLLKGYKPRLWQDEPIIIPNIIEGIQQPTKCLRIKRFNSFF